MTTVNTGAPGAADDATGQPAATTSPGRRAVPALPGPRGSAGG